MAELAQNDNNGITSLPVIDEEDDEPMVGPGPAPAPTRRPKRPLQFEQAYLDALPSANMYTSNLQFLILYYFHFNV